MNSEIPEFIALFNEKIREAEVFAFVARDIGLQKEAIEALTELSGSVSTEKSAAIQSRNEDYANLLLGCECVTEALAAELKMWVLLKQGNPDSAWDQLVAAQMASIDAVRAHPSFAHLLEHNRRLEQLETLVFPPQVFVSSGMIVRRQECSICGTEYGDCDHLLGKPYMGRFCYIIAKDLSLDHLAIVEHPADKRCRIQHFETEDGTRNRMTWKFEPKEMG